MSYETHTQYQGIEETKNDIKLAQFVSRHSFSSLLRLTNLSWPIHTDTVNVPSDVLIALFKILASSVLFDETWYFQAYPDIKLAIDDGSFIDAKHHYVEFGYFESRLPRFIRVDERFYLTNNPDVAVGIASGSLVSAQWHFENNGFAEGRLPEPGWSLLT
jgi:hypothetical protein